MRVLLAAPLFLFVTLMASCQSTPATPATHAEPELTQARITALRHAFLAAPDGADELRQLIELETQATRLVEDEPLKLGAIGTAILDICQASLTGHYALQRFYDHVGSRDAAASHQEWIDSIKAIMAGAASATPDDPYTAMTPAEAIVFVTSESLSPVGSIYQSSDPSSFVMLVVGRPETGPLQNFHFDLQALYRNALDILTRQSGKQAADIGFSPLALMAMLARQGDATAQAALGALLIARQQYDDATGWLRSASRTGNVVANVMLARIFWEKSELAETEEEKRQALDQVLENYLHAIALGSSDAMYALGRLYLTGAFGEDNTVAGTPLLEQAGDLDHSDALLSLAFLHYEGQALQRDAAAAEAYFIRAAALQNPAARLSYARYLMAERDQVAGDERAITWLEDLVEQHNDPQAMLLLGNLHARGVTARQNLRAAYRWYRDAARAAPNDADIVNEVAWTLTVSDLDRLRKKRYALKIMTRMMEADEQARESPEFLDTWAAAFAANGKFEEAVRLQQLALKQAVDADRQDVLDILKEHLDLFMAGKPVIEPAP